MRISDWSSDVCSSDLSICRTHFHRSARRNGIHRPAWPALLVQTDRIRPAGPGWARSGPGGGCGTSGLDQSCVMFLPREAPELPPRSERRTDVTDWNLGDILDAIEPRSEERRVGKECV